ncbi:hypothetical protein KJ359_008848 [Pestalotiopsis sp. 9143b]|nr:hypothetical protein KJ359_008848 [Pestalotiopsis sp. 9143b]
MCLLVNTYNTCALFGHPIQEANATKGFDTLLCDQAKANRNTLGECEGVTARNVPDFAFPYCTECDEVDMEMRVQIEAALQANEAVGGPETEILTEEFVSHLRGLPIDRERAPAVPAAEMIDFLRGGAARPVAEVDQRRAEIWDDRRKRGLGLGLSTSSDLPATTRRLFAHWLVVACKVRHMQAAKALAEQEGDESRYILLRSLAAQTSLAPIYRARLVHLGVFARYLYLAGVGEYCASESESVPGSPSKLDQCLSYMRQEMMWEVDEEGEGEEGELEDRQEEAEEEEEEQTTQ